MNTTPYLLVAWDHDGHADFELYTVDEYRKAFDDLVNSMDFARVAVIELEEEPGRYLAHLELITPEEGTPYLYALV